MPDPLAELLLRMKDVEPQPLLRTNARVPVPGRPGEWMQPFERPIEQNRNQAKVMMLRKFLGIPGEDVGDISQADYEAAGADVERRAAEDERRKAEYATFAPQVAGEYGLKHQTLQNQGTLENTRLGGANALAVEQSKERAATAAAAQQHGYTKEFLQGSGDGQESAFRPRIDAKGGVSFTSTSAPAQVEAQRHAAQIGLSNYPAFRQIIDSLDRSGGLGPVAGRTNEALTSTGFSSWFMNPQDAKNFNDFKSMASLVKSNLAMVHGGARGGGSPEIAKRFDQLINPHMSPDSIKGALDAFERWQTRYAGAKSSADLDQADMELGVSPSPARRQVPSQYLSGPGWEPPQ